MRRRCPSALALGMAIAVSGCAQPASAPQLPAARAPAAARAATVPTITLDAGSSGPAVSADLYGGNVVTWFDFTQAFVDPAMSAAHLHLVRFPGGSESDNYHWENGGTLCDPGIGYVNPKADTAHLVRTILRPLHFDLALTLNYGSNRACNGGGEPSEAVAWVRYLASLGVAAGHFTLGNEVYGSWEYDLHPVKHDPATYARAFKNGFYPAVKKAEPNALMGVVAGPPSVQYNPWNAIVLSQSGPFDFVEMHYYPEFNDDDDATLLGADVDNFAASIAALRVEMDRANVAASVPIYLGEYNSDAGNPGKQSVSIVNGLYLGQILGDAAQAGIPMATWWVENGSCATDGEFPSTIYGWQTYGSYALFSDGLPDPYDGCGSTPKVPGGTPFPTGRVMALFSSAAPAGSQVRSVTISPSQGDAVRAYGFASSGGYSLVLFNNTLEQAPVSVAIARAKRTYDASLQTYGKPQYDRSRENRWVGPASRSLGAVTLPLRLTLPPYSATALVLR